MQNTTTVRVDTTEGLRQIVEGGNYGRVIGLGQAVSHVQDDEPIVGAEATEFSREALLHPERYWPIVNAICTLAKWYGVTLPYILDFGCGPAFLSSLIARRLPAARVLGIDLSADMLKIARANIEMFGVAERFQLCKLDVRLVAGGANRLADFAVSRNMLHRVEGLAETLYRMTLAVKPTGGMVLIAAFRQVSDLDTTGQAAFIQAVREREGEPELVRAFVRAHLSAPTLAEYQRACRTVAKRLDVAEMRVWPGKHNNVGIFFRR